MTKATLYTFGGSIWGAAAELAVASLGYTDDEVELKSCNLVNGENFEESFLKLNPNATLPTLVVSPSVTYGSTYDVVNYLVSKKPGVAGKVSDTKIIEVIHDENVDPNKAFLVARSEADLKEHSAGFPGTFVRSRQAKLESLLKVSSPENKAFYERKIAENGFLVTVYDGKGDHIAFFAEANAHWQRIANLITDELPKYLPDSGFIGGDKPGPDDFHVGAWLARIGMLTGGPVDADGWKSIAKELNGKPVPAKVQSYWAAWSAQPAWKKVYAAGLH